MLNLTTLILLLSFLVSCQTQAPCNCENKQGSGPTTVEIPKEETKTEEKIPQKTANIQALDSLEFPQFSKEENWKSQVKRTILGGQTTGFIVRGDLCTIPLDKLSILQGIEVKYNSAIEYQKGTYYDILIPANETNCKTAKYGWVDISETLKVGDFEIVLTKKGVAPKVPTMPLTMLLGPHGFNLGLNGQKYENGGEKLSLKGNKILNDHRISVHQSWILPYKHELDSLFPFKEYVLGSSLGVINLPHQSTDAQLQDMDKEIEGYKWFYVVDEPNADQLKSLPPILERLKKNAPNTKRLVTTYYKEGYDIDLYCPPFEHLDYVPREKYGKNFCVYGACMGNGCGENRAWTQGKFTHYDYNKSGGPDIVIDAPYENEFGWFMVGAKYKADFMLYYATIESWLLPQVGIDIFQDQYNFGGNGDGTLLYPDVANKSAYVSIRLKYLREASYLLDAANQFGKLEYLTNKVKSGTKWDFKYSDREEIFK